MKRYSYFVSTVKFNYSSYLVYLMWQIFCLMKKIALGAFIEHELNDKLFSSLFRSTQQNFFTDIFYVVWRWKCLGLGSVPLPSEERRFNPSTRELNWTNKNFSGNVFYISNGLNKHSIQSFSFKETIYYIIIQ